MRNVIINYFIGSLLMALMMVPLFSLLFGDLRELVGSFKEAPFLWIVLLVIAPNVGAFLVFVIREVLDRSDD